MPLLVLFRKSVAGWHAISLHERWARCNLPMSPKVEAPLTSESPRVPEAVRTSGPRVISIDIFRGLTMAVMIFVNELSDVRGLPWWTYHAPARVDVMTYVDMVFPFFLFAVGMSLPLSVAQRLKRNSSLSSLLAHVAVRVLGLIVLGEILANAEKADPARMGMSGSTWALARSHLCGALFKCLRKVGAGSDLFSRSSRLRTRRSDSPAYPVSSHNRWRSCCVAGLFISRDTGSHRIQLFGRGNSVSSPLAAGRGRPPSGSPCSSLSAHSPQPKSLSFPISFLSICGLSAMESTCCIIMAGVVTSVIFLRPDGRSCSEQGRLPSHWVSASSCSSPDAF